MPDNDDIEIGFASDIPQPGGSFQIADGYAPIISYRAETLFIFGSTGVFDPMITIDLDAQTVKLSEKATADEAAREFWNAVKALIAAEKRPV